LYEAIAPQNEPALHGIVVDEFGQNEPNGHDISAVEPSAQYEPMEQAVWVDASGQ
jgi:hypothetical protein